MLHVTHPRPLSWKFRLLMLLPLLVMASMPLFVYFQFEHEHILLWMWLILIGVQFVLSMRTARLASRMVTSVRKNDALTLSRDEARRFPLYVLKSVFRATWIDHALLVLPRLGVALAFMQFLHISSFWSLYASNTIITSSLFTYFSYETYYISPSEMMVFPDVIQIVCLFIIVATYALMTNLVSIAIGVGLASCMRGNLTPVVTLIMHVMILCLGFVFAFLHHYPFIYDPPSVHRYIDECKSTERVATENFSYQYKQKSGQRIV